MNTNESQFPKSHVKVIKDAAHADEEYGYGPEEYEDKKGVKLDVMGKSDLNRKTDAHNDDRFLAVRNRKAKEAGKTPIVKINSGS